MNTIELPVRAKHFKDADYHEPCQCPLAKAAKDLFNTSEVSEDINVMDVDDKTYRHAPYFDSLYLDDNKKAVAVVYDETIIRTIILTPC